MAGARGKITSGYAGWTGATLGMAVASNQKVCYGMAARTVSLVVW